MRYYNNEVGIEQLLGKTLAEVTTDGCEQILFVTTEGETYKMYHDQGCCENVEIEDINGDIQDLIGSPILQAEESTSDEDPKESYTESFTWTFYKLATIKGYVTIRWYGTSNGYYSESVNFVKVN